MEFQINKIDTVLRREVNEETKEGKIHNKNGIVIGNDEENHKNKSMYTKEQKNTGDKDIKKVLEEDL
jgi:hypothetical protein